MIYRTEILQILLSSVIYFRGRRSEEQERFVEFTIINDSRISSREEGKKTITSMDCKKGM